MQPPSQRLTITFMLHDIQNPCTWIRVSIYAPHDSDRSHAMCSMCLLSLSPKGALDFQHQAWLDTYRPCSLTARATCNCTSEVFRHHHACV
jgi:hypothetical protein